MTLPAWLLLGTIVPTHLGAFMAGKNDKSCPAGVVKWLSSSFPGPSFLNTFLILFFVNAFILGRL